MAAELRKSGERVLSSRVKELGKPTLPAWTVNQLARRRELDVQRLVNAGEQLKQRQRDAITGGDGPEAFVEARAEERRVLDRLVEGAREILETSGHGATEATLDRVRETLRAAAVSDERREALKQGHLAEELTLSGFDALAGLTTAKRPRAQPKPRTPARAQRPAQQARPPQRQLREEQAREKAREKLLAARAEAREQTRQADDAERAVAAARRALERAENDAARLRVKAERAQESAQRAEDDLKRRQP